MKFETLNYDRRLLPCKTWFRSDDLGGLGEYAVQFATVRFLFRLCLSFLVCHAHRSHRWTDFDELYVIWRLSVQRYAFCGFVDVSSHFGVKSPTSKWAWMGIFKPNSQNMKTCLLSKLLFHSNQTVHGDKDHQILFVSAPNSRTTNPRWRRFAILKLKNRHISGKVWSVATNLAR